MYHNRLDTFSADVLAKNPPCRTAIAPVYTIYETEQAQSDPTPQPSTEQTGRTFVR